MTWKCSVCDEIHGDQFDTCWRCAEDPSAQEEIEGNSASKLSRLLYAKIASIVISGWLAWLVANGPRADSLNLFTWLFVISLFCLVPRIRWSGPLVILGACFGFLSGSSFESANVAMSDCLVVGTIFGLAIGVSTDLFWQKVAE